MGNEILSGPDRSDAETLQQLRLALETERQQRLQAERRAAAAESRATAAEESRAAAEWLVRVLRSELTGEDTPRSRRWPWRS